MPVLVQDVLTNPMGIALAGVVFKVVAQNNQGTVKTAPAIHTTNSSGEYSFNLINNTYKLYVKVADTFEELGKCIVEDSTPTPVTLQELLRYTSPVITPDITNPDPVWENLYASIQSDIQVTAQEDLQQIRDDDTYSSESKHIWTGGNDNGTMTDEIFTISTGSASVSKRPTAYSDDSQNHSAQDDVSVSIPSGSASKSLDIRSTGGGDVQAKDTVNLVTPDGQIDKNTAISNSSSVDSEAVTFKGNTQSKNTEITGTSVITNEGISHTSGNYTTGITKDSTYELGYRDDDQVEVPDKPKLEQLEDISIVGEVHDINLVSKLLARIDQMGEAIVELRKEITVNNKTISMVQSNDGVTSSVTHTADSYVVKGDAGNAILDVDTVNNTVNVNGNLVVGNAAEFKGEPGSTTFQVFQYSSDNGLEDVWHDTWNTGDDYRRDNINIDGYVDPNTWSSGYLLNAQDGLDGDTLYIEYSYSANNVIWHSSFEDGDIWRKERTIENGLAITDWSAAGRIIGSDGVDGEITEIAYQYSVDGFDPWHSNFSTGDHYRRERIEYFKTVVARDAGDAYLVTPWSSATQMVPIKGSDYFDGLNQTVVYLYQRAIGSAPTLPTQVLTYDFQLKTLTGDLEGWSTSVPTGISTIWITAATASSITTTDPIAANEWVSPEILGTSPYNQATVSIYKRSGSVPATPSTVLDYDFTLGTLTGDLEGWVFGSLPSGIEDLYMATASVVAQYTSATIAVDDWATGLLTSSVFKQETVHLYLRANTLPNAPISDITYNFTDGSISGLTGGWSTDIPDGVDDMYIAIAVASSNGNIDTITSSNWSVGLLGASGYQTVVITLYTDSDSVPMVPSNEVAYDFKDKQLTIEPNNNWSTQFPVNTTGKIWITTATANGSALAISDNIPTNEWTNPEVFLEVGQQVATVTLYRIANEVLDDTNLPTIDLNYSFITGKLLDTPDNGWSTEPVSNVSVVPVWITTASVSTKTVNDTDVIVSGEWTTPIVLVKSGSTIYDEYQYSVDAEGTGGWHVEWASGYFFQRVRTVTDGEYGEWKIGQYVPIKDIDYNDGTNPINVFEIYEYSVDGISDWHDTFEDTDFYRRTAVVVAGEISEWSEPAKLSGEDGSAVLVRLVCDEGFFFKNNAGAVKKIDTEVWVNGVKILDYSSYNFHWRVGDDTVYTTATGDFVSISPAGGLYPANGEAVGGLNFHSIYVDFSDVVDGRSLNLTCEITNI